MIRVTKRSETEGYQQRDYKTEKEAISRLLAWASDTLKNGNVYTADTFTIEKY